MALVREKFSIIRPHTPIVNMLMQSRQACALFCDPTRTTLLVFPSPVHVCYIPQEYGVKPIEIFVYHADALVVG